MKDDQVVVIIKDRKKKRHRRIDEDRVKNGLRLKVIKKPNHLVSVHWLNVIDYYSPGFVKTEKKKAENRSVFFVEVGIDFDVAHEFYRGSF